MLKRIKKIENLGQFELFESNQDFDMNNIVFGFNGAGKSTLSDMFYSLANENQEELVVRRRTLNRENEDFVKNIDVEIQDDNGGAFCFVNEKWCKHPNNMFVFNNQYVNDHVFVSKQIDGNAVPIGMGKEGAKYMRQREALTRDNVSLINEINEKIKCLSDAGLKIKDFSASKITKKTSEKKIEKIALMSLYPIAEKSKIEERIKSNEKYTQELAVIEKCKSQYESINSVESFSVASVIRQVKKVPRITSKEIAGFLESAMTSTDIRWAVRGYLNRKDNNICPMCGQLIVDKKAKQFFVKLGKYVCQNKDDKIKELSTELHQLAYKLETLAIADRIIVFVDIINCLNENGLLTKKDAARLEKGLLWTTRNTDIINNLVVKIKEKAENPFADIVLTEDENNSIKLLNSIVKNILVMNEILDNVYVKIEKKNEKKFSMDDLGKLFELSYGVYRPYAEEMKSKASQLLRNYEKIKLLNEKINDCYNQSRLVKVNEFLLKLNTHIKIEVRQNKYYVKLKDYRVKPYESGRETLFSEGEQRAVAFAYFLAEIESLETENKIIIIDDPISSMDLSRKSIISHQIAEMMNNAHNQIIVMTHDIGFVERVVSYLDSKTETSLLELRAGKSDFYSLCLGDYLTDDKTIYRQFIVEAESSSRELDKVIAFMAMRPFAYVNQIAEDKYRMIEKKSTYFAHTLYSKNGRIEYRQEDYDNLHLKNYVKLINEFTNSSFDENGIAGDYNFQGFDFENIANMYFSVSLDSMTNMRKKVMMMRPLIEACFFQFSSKEKFDPEHIGKIYTSTIRANSSNPLKKGLCLSLKELYDASKKYHHGADEGSLLGISWINPNEVEYFDKIMTDIVKTIKENSFVKDLSA